MKKKIILVAILVIIIGVPMIIGSFLPKEKIVTEKTFIDKMYFFILADITNHWEEPSWRTELDTMIQAPEIDGMDVWKEFYTNGDSIQLMTQVTGNTDYIRIIVDKDGRHRMRSIMLVDVSGKTAIRMSEEIFTGGPYKRFFSLFNDTSSDHLKTYLADLKEKNKPKDTEDNQGNW